MKIKSFSSAKAWDKWLTKNHAKSDGLWLQIFKKNSGTKTVTYDEALDVALCYGWIDGQKNKYDKNSWIQKFTSRRAKSMWSKRNKEHVTRLTKSGKMKPAGLKEIETAKADGRWEQAYDSPSNMKVPDDFLKTLAQNKKALVFFNALNKANTYAIAWRLQTAKKPETRKKRMRVLLEMMAKGEKFHQNEQIKSYMFGTNTVTDWKVGSPIFFRSEWEGKYDLLFGRKTYDLFAGYWPQHTDGWPQVDKTQKRTARRLHAGGV